jgi:hypothetical protein
VRTLFACQRERDKEREIKREREEEGGREKEGERGREREREGERKRELDRGIESTGELHARFGHALSMDKLKLAFLIQSVSILDVYGQHA